MKIRTFSVTTILALTGIVFLGGCRGDRPGTDSGDEGSQSMLRRSLHHDGAEREYFVHIPPNADSSVTALPVVVAIHGYTSTATGFQVAHRLNPHADEHGYIVVYPQGSHFEVVAEDGNSFLITSWNDLAANQSPKPEGPHCTDQRYQYPCPPECGECNRCGWTSCYDDVGFIERMLDAVQTEFSPDPQRFYLLGVNNGGMMALRLGCNLSARFAAVVPINAQLAPGYACGPESSLPMLHLYGGEDNTVRYDGKPAADGYIYTTAAKTAEIWAESMTCNGGPAPWENEFSKAVGLSCSAYTECKEAAQEVVSCMDPDQGHDWPGQRVSRMSATCVTSEQYDSLPDQAQCPPVSDKIAHQGMDLVWDFMRRYRRGGNDLQKR
jgi:poly(3-hydroxybutyrate) depolymerase